MTRDVTHSSQQFAAADGLRLTRQAWRPKEGTTAVLALVHGYGEHGGRYRELAVELAGHGLAVHVYDLRGHGLSGGRRGHITRFTDYLNDTAVYLDAVRSDDPGLPLFLLGHSMGGLIAAGFVEQRPAGFAGLVLSAPFLRLALEVPPLRIHAARIISVVAPTFDIGNTLDAAGLSHDEAVVAAYRIDPLNHFKATARWASEVLAAQTAALAAAPDITLPLLVMYGSADSVADPAAVHELFAAASAADKTEHAYAAYYHEIFNETGREKPIADLLTWLGEHGASV